MTVTESRSSLVDAPGHVLVTSRFWRMFPAGMRRRWWMFRPFDLAARLLPWPKRRRGLLVVRMDGIGDMVLFRTSLDHYAEAFRIEPANITVLGCRSWGALAPEVFAGYRVLVIDEHAFARRPWYRFRVALRVRALAPAVAVCDSYFRRALMADSLAWISGAPRVVSSLPYISERTRAEYTYYLGQAGRVVNTGVYPDHEVVRHYRFVSAMAGRTIPPEAPRIAWRDRPPPVPEGHPYVVLNPGSNEPGRRWPIAGYLGVAERLLGRGYRVVFVGTPRETSEVERRAAFAKNEGVFDLVGRTSLPEVLDLMKRAAGVVTNDSGPAHVAIALRTPTVVIVGGGHFGCFFPYPEQVAPANARFVFVRKECYHCFWRCPYRQDPGAAFPCIAAVGEDAVWAATEEVLAVGGIAR